MDVGSWAVKFKVHSSTRVTGKAINDTVLAFCVVYILVSNERYLYPMV